MQVCGYTSDELKLFHRVLDAAIGEAVSRDQNLPLHTMTKRLFDAAVGGERDPDRLKAAILDGEPVPFRQFGSPQSDTLAATSEST